MARESYDIIVVDTSPFFHGPMLATLDLTDELLMLCGLDVPTLKNVRLSMQTLELLSFPASRIRFVLNRANSKVGMKKSEVEGALDIKIGSRCLPTGPSRSASTGFPGRRRHRLGLREGDPTGGQVAARERAAEEAAQVRRFGQGVGPWASTTDSKQNGNGAAGVTAERPAALAGPVAHPTQQASPAPSTGASDPYGELKSGIHHAVIAKLGPELFKRETGEDLTERVLHAVTEQLALDRTPLTREERRRIVREIADDVLGYGPLEELLRDDSITEVMVNRHDMVFIEREGRIERTDVSFADNAHLLRIIDKIVSQVGRRIDEPCRWSTRASPTAAA